VRTAEDGTRSIRPFNLGEAMAKDADDDLPLQKLDELTVRSIWEIQERHTVSINGSVREPGTYEYLEGMTIMDLIFRAGGLKESAYKQEARSRASTRARSRSKKSADVYRVAISGNYGVHSPDPTSSSSGWTRSSSGRSRIGKGSATSSSRARSGTQACTR
jgi:hypothetical protein